MMLARTNTGMIGFDGVPMDFRAPRVWVALQARTSKEQDAADWLKASRLFAYWPCYAKDSNAGGTKANGFARRRVRYNALIPGYIFVAAVQGCDPDPSLVINQTPGIIGYMRDPSGFPMTLGEDDIQKIRRIESDENKPPDPKTAHKFKTGQKVRFSDRLLGGWSPGHVERLADDGRISIGVPLLGRIVTMLVFPHQIEAM